jgi:NAD(P) transhydrogenase subunit alpha
MVRRMAPGSVVVDIAAERGGNCEITRPGETVQEQGVTVLGPLNLAATVPYHASQMYAKNIANLLLLLDKNSEREFDLEDEVIRETLVTRGGDVVHPRVRELIGMDQLVPEGSQA